MRRILCSLAAALAAVAASAAAPAVAGPTTTIATLAGGLPQQAPAESLSLRPGAVAADGNGGVYAADAVSGLVWHVTDDGRATVVAGDGRPCTDHRLFQPFPPSCRGRAAGDGGPALGAHLTGPHGLALAPDGALFVSQPKAHDVRRIDLRTGTITTVAGNGLVEPWFDEGGATRGTDVSLGTPQDLAADSRGNLYIGDWASQRILRLTPDGTIEIVAGCLGNCTTSPEDGSGLFTSAFPADPAITIPSLALAVGPGDRLYVGSRNAVFEADLTAGVYRLVAGHPAERALTRRVEDVAAEDARFSEIGALTFGRSGELYVVDNDWNHIVRVSAPLSRTSTVSLVAGCYCGPGPVYDDRNGYSGDGGDAREASFSLGSPFLGEPGVAVDATGALVVGDLGNNRLRRISGGMVRTIAGNGRGPWTTGYVTHPYSFQPVAAPGSSGGDGQAATNAQLHQPSDVAVDRAGNVYIADRLGNRIRRVTTDGRIETVAGTGCVGAYGCEIDALPLGDGSFATAASLYAPAGIALDATGTQLYIADTWHARIRQVNLGTATVTVHPLGAAPIHIPPGRIATIAGSGYRCATIVLAVRGNDCGDGRPASSARFLLPVDVAVDEAANLYIADPGTHQVRVVDARTGIIRPFAGVPWVAGCTGYGDEGLTATATRLCAPTNLAVTPQALYIAETGDEVRSAPRVRRVDLTSAAALTRVVAGNGTVGSSGDGGPARNAQLAHPHGVAAGADGALYIADTGNSRLRRVAPDGSIATVAGTGAITGGFFPDGCRFSGDGGAAAQAALCAPLGIAVGPDDAVYVADQLNNRIRVVRAR